MIINVARKKYSMYSYTFEFSLNDFSEFSESRQNSGAIWLPETFYISDNRFIPWCRSSGENRIFHSYQDEGWYLFSAVSGNRRYQLTLSKRFFSIKFSSYIKKLVKDNILLTWSFIFNPSGSYFGKLVNA